MIPASLNMMMLSSGNPLWFDLFPTPELAFSFRQLNSLATQCIAIRDTSGGNLAYIGFVDGYLDIATLSTWMTLYGTTAKVIQMFNQNLSSSIQAIGNTSAAVCPNLELTVTENGKQVLQFSGSMSLRFTDSTNSPTLTLAITGDYTFLEVSKNRTSTANTGSNTIVGNSAGGLRQGFLPTLNGVSYIQDGSASYGSFSEDIKTFCSIMYSRTSGTRTAKTNQVVKTITNTTTAISSNLDNVGIHGGFKSSSNFAELIFYNNTNVSSIIDQMQQNQMAYYGIT